MKNLNPRFSRRKLLLGAFQGTGLLLLSGCEKVFDSLSRNAYGIYLLHYVYAIWLQYALLNAPLSGVEKGGIVFAATLILSWATTALLRSFPAIARVI